MVTAILHCGGFPLWHLLMLCVTGQSMEAFHLICGPKIQGSYSSHLINEVSWFYENLKRRFQPLNYSAVEAMQTAGYSMVMV